MLKLDISAGMLRMKDKKTSAPAEMSRERQCSRGNVHYEIQCLLENIFLLSSTVLDCTVLEIKPTEVQKLTKFC